MTRAIIIVYITVSAIIEHIVSLSPSTHSAGKHQHEGEQEFSCKLSIHRIMKCGHIVSHGCYIVFLLFLLVLLGLPPVVLTATKGLRKAIHGLAGRNGDGLVNSAIVILPGSDEEQTTIGTECLAFC